MKHFPIFLNLDGQNVVVAGGGAAALAKTRLLVKTQAHLTLYCADAEPELVALIGKHGGRYVARPFASNDAIGAALVYAASESAQEDARVAAIARAEGTLVNIVDNLDDSDFITPAIVDRDPVTIAIGTEGTAPVLARQIKRDLEDRLPTRLGHLARLAKAFRPMAEALPMGRPRRAFWADFFHRAKQDHEAPQAALEDLLQVHLKGGAQEGHVAFVSAGPGDPELLTLKARAALDAADVVIYDRLVAPEILELARREATLIDAGKTAFGPSTPQSEINDLMVRHAQAGAHVVRLKSGDAVLFGRLDEEITALEAANIRFWVIPGVTAASSAAAALGQSLTKRGRNSSLRFLTGHDVKGFADHDWRALAQPGEVTAIYMGKRAARFLQGRLLMHGAHPETPVSVIENASRPTQSVLTTTLANLSEVMASAQMTGPAITLLGLAARKRAAAGITSEPHATQDIA